MRLLAIATLFLAATLVGIASAEMKIQCHNSGGGDNTGYSSEPSTPRPRNPDLIKGSTDDYSATPSNGLDHVTATFGDQSIRPATAADATTGTASAASTKAERRARRAARLKAWRAKLQSAVQTADAYMQANTGALSQGTAQSLQVAFQNAVTRGPASTTTSLVPGSSTLPKPYGLMFSEGSQAAR